MSYQIAGFIQTLVNIFSVNILPPDPKTMCLLLISLLRHYYIVCRPVHSLNIESDEICLKQDLDVDSMVGGREHNSDMIRPNHLSSRTFTSTAGIKPFVFKYGRPY